MKFDIAVLPGDGRWAPRLVAEALKVLKVVGERCWP